MPPHECVSAKYKPEDSLASCFSGTLNSCLTSWICFQGGVQSGDMPDLLCRECRLGWLGEGFEGGMLGCCCSLERGRLRTEEWCASMEFLSAQGHLVGTERTAVLCWNKYQDISLSLPFLSLALSLSPSLSFSLSFYKCLVSNVFSQQLLGIWKVQNFKRWMKLFVNMLLSLVHWIITSCETQEKCWIFSAVSCSDI